MKKILLFAFSFALGYAAHEIQFQTVALAQTGNTPAVRAASDCQGLGNSTCIEDIEPLVLQVHTQEPVIGFGVVCQTCEQVPIQQEPAPSIICLGQQCGPVGGGPIRAPLSARELIEVMADFDIRHALAVPGQDWYGMTEFDARRITMESDMDLTQRRRVAIHEAWHIALRLRGDDAYGDEVLIAKLVDSEYKRMFGSAQ